MRHQRRQTFSFLWVLSVSCMLLCTACSDASSGDVSPTSNTPDTPDQGLPGQSGPANGQVGVRGLVLDATGAPVAGVFVVPVSTDTPAKGVPEIAVFTDEQGLYTWPLASGTYTITFSHEGYKPTQKAIQIPDGVELVLNVTLEHI